MDRAIILCFLVIFLLTNFDKVTGGDVNIIDRLSDLDVEGEKIYKSIYYNLMKKEPPEDIVEETETSTQRKEQQDEDLIEKQIFKNPGSRVIWPKGIIPYTIDKNSFSKPDISITVLEKAIAIWSNVTCVKFWDITDTPNGDWVSELGDNHFTKIVNSDECTSYTGKAANTSHQNFQTVMLKEKGCMRVGSVLHELGHLLGLVHEHTRTDRDEHIKISKENVRSNYLSNFEILDTMDNTKFDYSSIMHYGVKGFTYNNKNTITLKDSNLNFLAGQRDYLSFYDIKAINLAYNCSGEHQVFTVLPFTIIKAINLPYNCSDHCPNSTHCQNDGYIGPDCVCICPSVLGGDSCDSIADEWKSTGCNSSVYDLATDGSIEIKSPNFPFSYGNKKCAWLVKGPREKNLSVSLSMDDIPRNKHLHKCFHSVEIRFNLIGQKGLSFCGFTTFPYNFESLGNTVLVILHAEDDNYAGKNFVVKVASGRHKSACMSNPCPNFGQTCVEGKEIGEYNCACSEKFSGSDCSVIESISCSFDWRQGPQPVCLFSQNKEDDLDWIQRKIRTVSSRTGPPGDVTGEGSYMYMEASFPAKRGYTAILDSALIGSGQKCVSFYYHMYGDRMGYLYVTMESDITKTWAQKWMKARNQGNQWKHVLISVTAATNFRMHIKAKRGSGYRSDIAIDSLTVTKGACYASTSAENVNFTISPKSADNCHQTYAGANCDEINEAHCNFDTVNTTDLCIFRNAEGNDYYWLKHMGSTRSTGTGPRSDYSGNMYYLYAEASKPAKPGDIADLVTGYIHGGNVCIRLYIYMYGENMGTLVIKFKDVSNNEKSYENNENLGNRWQPVWFSVHSVQKFKMIIESVRGSTFRSDIAIDEFHLSRGDCREAANQIDLS